MLANYEMKITNKTTTKDIENVVSAFTLLFGYPELRLTGLCYYRDNGFLGSGYVHNCQILNLYSGGIKAYKDNHSIFINYDEVGENSTLILRLDQILE